MTTDSNDGARPRPAFTIIGENIHATRVVLRNGPRVAIDDDRVAIKFVDRSGAPRLLPLAQPILASSEFASGKIKHVRNALLLGMGADGVAGPEVTGRVTSDDGLLAREYLLALALRQVEAGAAYLDVNVDELAASAGIRGAAMTWLVRQLEPEVPVPLALDSSSGHVLRAGLAASSGVNGAPLLNSASLERLDALDLAAEAGCPIVLSAVGATGMPADAADRIANASKIIDEAFARGLPAASLFVDPLVLPVGVDPEAGRGYLDAVRAIRAARGGDIHLTGGLSNVSFGLPTRRLLNDVFVALAMDAGADSGIIDPLVTAPDRIAALDRASGPVRLAEALLTGADPYGMEYLTAFRDGRLSAVGV